MSDNALRRKLKYKGLDSEEIEHALTFRNFARTQFNLEMHVGQLAFAGVVLVRRRAHIARYTTLWLTAGNRAGKTTLLTVLILYSVLAKLGVPRPNENDVMSVLEWGAREYHWYHFGIQQKVSDLVFKELKRILGGTHVGQHGKGCPLTRMGGAYEKSDAIEICNWDAKEYGEYSWVQFKPEVGGGQIHFRTTSQKSLGELGADMHGISFDEAAIEPALEFLFNEVFDNRRLGTGGQFIGVSTPSEAIGTMFKDMWEQGEIGNRKRNPDWMSLRMSARENVGYGLDEEIFLILIEGKGERYIKQNIDGYFLQPRAAYFDGDKVDQCFVKGMPVHSRAQNRVTYLQGVDPAKSSDSAWSITLGVHMPYSHTDHVRQQQHCECKPYLVGVHAARLTGQRTSEQLTDLAADAAFMYNQQRIGATCYTAIDATGFGGKMYRELIEQIVPNLYNIEFGGTSHRKKQLLGNLRTVIDEGRLILPAGDLWDEVRAQLLGYKEQDKGLSTDAVMALVCAVRLVDLAPSDGAISQPFNTSRSV